MIELTVKPDKDTDGVTLAQLRRLVREANELPGDTVLTGRVTAWRCRVQQLTIAGPEPEEAP